jgi:hypothetical protein
MRIRKVEATMDGGITTSYLGVPFEEIVFTASFRTLYSMAQMTLPDKDDGFRQPRLINMGRRWLLGSECRIPI